MCSAHLGKLNISRHGKRPIDQSQVEQLLLCFDSLPVTILKPFDVFDPLETIDSSSSSSSSNQ